MKVIRKVAKWIAYLLAIPITYLVVSLVLTLITINKTVTDPGELKEVYLNTNGVHLDIIIPRSYLSEELKADLLFSDNDNYLAFGWGDENFYVNTPTWGDLTFNNAFKAMFLKSSTLIHLTRYQEKRGKWTVVRIDNTRLAKLNEFTLNGFKTDETGAKILLPDQGYFSNDDFYKANGSYSCFNTCNTWVNDAFKASDLKASLWTPFDFGLLNKY